MNAYTEVTRTQTVVENLMSTLTFGLKLVSQSRMYSGKREVLLQESIKSTFTTTRSTRSDAARTQQNSNSSSMRGAISWNSTETCPWAIRLCWSQNLSYPLSKNVQRAEGNSNKPFSLQAEKYQWKCLNKKRLVKQNLQRLSHNA